MKEQKYCPLCGESLVKKITDGRERLSCPSGPCGYVFWDNPVPVVAAIVEMDSGVVLARNRLWPEKMFGLITGFLEKGEAPEEAVVREVREELGIEAGIQEFVGLYAFTEMNQLIIAYQLSAAGNITLNEELAEYKIVPVGQLRPWPMGTGHALRDWLNRRASR